ncbi:hypothetical protein L3X38_033389 [Prunus dulcis]|uniref:Uncharacterized protein n=1 Tax=Prunus dulcis TaxID=3755 RepID=A0AAD4VHZ4_PRUDU|nr:hypothetical protein L3X38_033389 [Prunus dulcis]
MMLEMAQCQVLSLNITHMLQWCSCFSPLGTQSSNPALSSSCLKFISPPSLLNKLSRTFPLERPESFKPPSDIKKSNNKRKRGSDPSVSAVIEPSADTTSIDEDDVRKKLSAHFMILRDIKENQSLRAELDDTTSSIQLYEEYNQRKEKAKKPKTKKIRSLLTVNWTFLVLQVL